MSVPLEEVRGELDAVRAALLHPRAGGAAELVDRLERVVQVFGDWMRAGPDADGADVNREAVEEIAERLARLQPLFDNAYQLQAGWYRISVLESETSGYTNTGEATRLPAAEESAGVSG